MTARTDGLFVGRDEELQAVEEALNGLTRGIGPPPAVLIVGEPGMGKTTLMHHVLRGADGIRRLRLAGFEPGTGIPLGAAAELFHVLRTASPQATYVPVFFAPAGFALRFAPSADAGIRLGRLVTATISLAPRSRASQT